MRYLQNINEHFSKRQITIDELVSFIEDEFDNVDVGAKADYRPSSSDKYTCVFLDFEQHPLAEMFAKFEEFDREDLDELEYQILELIGKVVSKICRKHDLISDWDPESHIKHKGSFFSEFDYTKCMVYFDIRFTNVDVV